MKLDYVLVDGDNGTQTEGKLLHPQQRLLRFLTWLPAYCPMTATRIRRTLLGVRNLKTPPDARILFLGWEKLDDYTPSETFVSENHQGSQMQDESAQLALQELALWALNKMANVDQLAAEVAEEVSLAWALWSSERNTCHQELVF